MKLNLLLVSCLLAGAFASLEDCKGNPDEFDAGWGSCDTYQVDHHKSNFFWCDSDMMDGLAADEVCAECGKCRIPVTQDYHHALVGNGACWNSEKRHPNVEWPATPWNEQMGVSLVETCSQACRTWTSTPGNQPCTGFDTRKTHGTDLYCVLYWGSEVTQIKPRSGTMDCYKMIPTGERSFPFLAWDSHCSLEENNARHYVATTHSFPDSEQACEEFCMDWDECTAFSFKYSDTNDCWAFKQCILEPATTQLSAPVNQEEYLVTRSFKPFPGPTSQGLKSFPFMAAGSVCKNHAHSNMRELKEPVSEKACAEFCSDWDECNAYSFVIRKQKIYCLAFKECDEVVDMGFLSKVTFQMTRLTTPLAPEEELFYDEFAFSQCGTSNTQFPGDRADNPLFSDFLMIGTADQCKKKCADPDSVDDHGRPCVAFEHSSQDPTEMAICRFAWDCSEIAHWGGGKVYKRTAPSNPAPSNPSCENISGVYHTNEGFDKTETLTQSGCSGENAEGGWSFKIQGNIVTIDGHPITASYDGSKIHFTNGLIYTRVESSSGNTRRLLQLQ